MEKWTVSAPLAGNLWTIPAGVEATLALGRDVPQGEAGMIDVRPGGALVITYAQGVRTDPTTRPRNVAGGSLLSYIVTEAGSEGPLYRIALNRAAGG